MSLMISTALDVAKCGCVAEPDDRKIYQALLIAAQASIALFAAAVEPMPVKAELASRRLQFDRRADESIIYASRWIQGFYLCVLCRKPELIERIIQVPSDALLGSTREPEYRRTYVEAIKASWRGEPSASKLILQALEQTDPERNDIRAPDWTLHLDVPQLQHLYYVNSGGSDFAAYFPDAIALHKKFWTSTRKRREDWNGFLAIELIGLASIGFERGMSFEFKSDYVPGWLVEGTQA